MKYVENENSFSVMCNLTPINIEQIITNETPLNSVTFTPTIASKTPPLTNKFHIFQFVSTNIFAELCFPVRCRHPILYVQWYVITFHNII